MHVSIYVFNFSNTSYALPHPNIEWETVVLQILDNTRKHQCFGGLSRKSPPPPSHAESVEV